MGDERRTWSRTITFDLGFFYTLAVSDCFLSQNLKNEIKVTDSVPRAQLIYPVTSAAGVV